MFSTFCYVLHETNYKQKNTNNHLESVKYGLEINFKDVNDFNSQTLKFDDHCQLQADEW